MFASKPGGAGAFLKGVVNGDSGVEGAEGNEGHAPETVEDPHVFRDPVQPVHHGHTLVRLK